MKERSFHDRIHTIGRFTVICALVSFMAVPFVLAMVNAFKIFKEVYFIGGAYPAESIYALQHYMNNKFAKLDYQDVTTAAYSFAVIVIALFLLLYRTKSVRQGEAA